MAMNPRLLRPRASGFDPRSISNLQLWFDGADASTITTVSGAVSQWNSKAGTGGNATQATASSRPNRTQRAERRGLGMQGMRKQSAFGVIQSDTGFIAGGFDTKNDHGRGAGR